MDFLLVKTLCGFQDGFVFSSPNTESRVVVGSVEMIVLGFTGLLVHAFFFVGGFFLSSPFFRLYVLRIVFAFFNPCSETYSSSPVGYPL